MHNKNIEEFTIRKWSVVYINPSGSICENFFKTRDKARKFKWFLKNYPCYGQVKMFKNEVILNGNPLTGIKVIRKTLSH